MFLTPARGPWDVETRFRSGPWTDGFFDHTATWGQPRMRVFSDKRNVPVQPPRAWFFKIFSPYRAILGFPGKISTNPAAC